MDDMNAIKVPFSLASTLESVDAAEQAAFETAARCGFDKDECGRIALAVREAAVNAIQHGNRFDTDKRVTLTFESTPERLTITVRDEGAGMDPDAIPDPLAPENFLKASGRGVFLIRTFMDKVEFRNVSPGTEITMTKFMHAPNRKNTSSIPTS
jgi:serine/threonine-protein kinase RsbW